MNQHSKRGGQANGNSVDEVRRGATRPAAVVAIVLCVGFAVAMVAISSCRKPQSQQEMQTQPEAAVQTETPKPESVETEIPKPEAVSRVSVPDGAMSPEPSTATPFSQASPAAPQLMDDHVNSPTPVEDDESYDFSYDLNEEATTFEAVNPTTKVPGQMTVTITGPFRGKRLGDGQSTAGSHLKADQQATFTFIPNDRYSPSYTATVRTLNVAGDTTDDSIHFDFGLEATGSDGSSQEFTLREVVTITEDGAHVTFSQLK
jgi:type IV secretory pathway VirB10-like protein